MFVPILDNFIAENLKFSINSIIFQFRINKKLLGIIKSNSKLSAQKLSSDRFLPRAGCAQRACLQDMRISL